MLKITQIKLNYSSMNEYLVQDEGNFISAKGGIGRIDIIGVTGAVFSLTMKDSSGCDVLEYPLDNISIPESGTYSYIHTFPVVKTKERYDINVYGGHNTDVSELFQKTCGSCSMYSIFQYLDPTITITQSTDSTGSTNPQTLTLGGSNVAVRGEAMSKPKGIATTTQTWDRRSRKFKSIISTEANVNDVSFTATKAGGYAGNLYVSRQPILSDFTVDTSYTRTASVSGAEVHPVFTSKLKLSPNTTDIEAGMRISGVNSFTRTVQHSVYPDGCDSNCNGKTDKFKLDNTDGIYFGMFVTAGEFTGFTFTHVDRETDIITVSPKVALRDLTELTFKGGINTIVESVDDLRNITTDSGVTIINGVTLTFEDNTSVIEEKLTATGSGSDTITIAGTVAIENFGIESVTYSLNVDDFITNTPSAYDQDVYVTKSTATDIYMLAGDTDLNKADKRATVVNGPSHGTVGSYSLTNDTITYTPYDNYVGPDKFTFTISDYTGDTIVSTSAEKTIYITVT